MIGDKKGFSTVEIMLVLFLTGILVALGTSAMRTVQSNYRHLYYAAFANLKHSAGELIAISPTQTLPTAGFCAAIADNYNVSDSTGVCTYTYDLSPSTTFSYSAPNLNNPSFTLSNGQRYYVGNAFKPVGAQNYFNASAIMVAVDLNGTAGPNAFDSRTYSGNATPDVVAFAILDNGTVIPMSPMADRADYIQANVETFNASDGKPSVAPPGNMIYKRISIRQALSVSNQFPPKGAGSTLGVQYNNDTTYSFKTSYAVDAACTSTTTFCRVSVINPLMGGIGMDL